MNDAYRILKKMKEKKEQTFALATIVHVDGSAYRHAGAKMLIGEDDSLYGTLSAGCLEEDLAYHAREVLQTRQPQTLIYHLKAEDDLSWGQGAGCNGSIQVYVEPCEWEARPRFQDEPVWPQVESLLDSGNKVASAKIIGEDNGHSVPLFYADNGTVLGDADQETRRRIIPGLKRFLQSGQKLQVVKPAHADADLLFELYEPREQLYLFGAGPDVEPIVRLASSLDFYVTLIDPRSSRCNKTVFPAADRCIPEHPEAYLQTNPIPGKSYVLIMTHSFQRDRHILRHLLSSPPYYVGVLGPRRRTERLFLPDAMPDWVHAPVGLRIGAEGPEEISVSVMAELLQIRNRR